MQIGKFIKDKGIYLALNVFVSAFSAFLLYMVEARLYFMLFIPLTYLSGCLIVLLIEFTTKNSYYKKLHSTLDRLDKKCLLAEVLEEPDFYEGLMLYELLKTTHKAMNDEIASHSLSSAEYRDYIELWVHEIKTPIAGAKLICENTDNKALQDSLERMDKLVEQALYYSRSSHVEKDFLIKEIQLKQLLNSVLRKNARYLIERKIKIDLSALDVTVYSDSKWLDFILTQILDNSVKYDSRTIKIYAEQNENSVSLFLFDDGIGIPKQDQRRVFDKGFTGENGRAYPKSTGLGLYLCKKLCDKLGLHILITSEQGIYTQLCITFPKSSMYP